MIPASGAHHPASTSGNAPANQTGWTDHRRRSGTAGVHQRRPLLIDRGGLSVEVRLVLVGIEDLDFIGAHHVDAAIAPFLAVPFDFVGGGKFYVQLAIAEAFLKAGANVFLILIRNPSECNIID